MDYMYETSIVSFNLPKIRKIGDYAFRDLSKLTSVAFPQLYSIGAYAFSGCTSLSSVDFPNLSSVGDGAFTDTALSSVTFPQLYSIGAHAFSRCISLSSVDFPRLSNIGQQAFSNCASLHSVDFPKVENIGGGVFSNCTSLTSVNLPELIQIDCISTSSVYSTRYNETFLNCTSLSSVNLAKVEQIVGDRCFEGCLSLKTVALPNLSYFDYRCFDGSSLTTLRLTATGNFSCRSGSSPFYGNGFASESCTLYLNSDKKASGSGSPQVKDETTWWDVNWKGIIFE